MLGVDAQPRSPAQADLGLRGSTFNQVVVLVDGVRVSDVQSGHYALDLAVPVPMIERIEILRGTGSAMYGSDAIGGVVNIVTRADSAFGDAATRAGSFGGALARGAVGGAVRGTLLRLGADIDRSSGHRDDTDYRIVQARAAGERRVGAARISADAAIGARQFGAADFYLAPPFVRDYTHLDRDDAGDGNRHRASHAEWRTAHASPFGRLHAEARGSGVLSERAPRLAAWRGGDGADRARVGAAYGRRRRAAGCTAPAARG